MTPRSLPHPARVASYARYSTDMQSASSIAAQHAKNQEYVASQGWPTAREHSDYAVSGTTHERAGYQEVLRLVEAREIDVSVVESLDRLSRNMVELPRLFVTATYNLVEIHTLDRRGAVSHLEVGLAGITNPQEIERIAQRTHRQLEQMVLRQGRSAGGRSYGYRVPVGDDGLRLKGELEIEPAEAAVILRIYREYAEGLPPRQIVAGLNRDGIAPPRSGKRKGREGEEAFWSQTTLNGSRTRGNGILNNRLYAGLRHWNRHDWVKHPETDRRLARARPAAELKVAPVPHLRIVPEDLWDAVKARQAAQDARAPARSESDATGLSSSQAHRRAKYLLSSVLVCSGCGGPLTIAGSGRKRYYCAAHKRSGGTACDGMPGILQEEVETRVLDGLQRLLMQDEAFEVFRAKVETHRAQLDARAGAALAALDHQIGSREREIAHLVEAVGKGRLTPSLLMALEVAEADLIQLRAKRAEETPQVIQLPADLPRVYRAHVQGLAASLSHKVALGRAAEALRGLIDKVVVTWDPVVEEHALAIEGNLGALLALGSTPLRRGRPQGEGRDGDDDLLPSGGGGRGLGLGLPRKGPKGAEAQATGGTPPASAGTRALRSDRAGALGLDEADRPNDEAPVACAVGGLVWLGSGGGAGIVVVFARPCVGDLLVAVASPFASVGCGGRI